MQKSDLEAKLTDLVTDGWLFHITPAANVSKITDTRTLVCPDDARSVGARFGIGSVGSRRDVVQLVDLCELSDGSRAEACARMVPLDADVAYHLLAISPDVRKLPTFRSHWHAKRYAKQHAIALRIWPHIEAWIEARSVQAETIRDLGPIYSP
jgi:hypothetical protein